MKTKDGDSACRGEKTQQHFHGIDFTQSTVKSTVGTVVQWLLTLLWQAQFLGTVSLERHFKEERAAVGEVFGRVLRGLSTETRTLLMLLLNF